MKKFDISKRLSVLKSKNLIMNMILIIAFMLVFTGVLVSKYFFLQPIIDSDNTSKVTVTAPKNIEVIDAVKTEKRKREVAQNVKVV
jgi:membrane-associated HD superfamily phosphohydrolase